MSGSEHANDQTPANGGAPAPASIEAEKLASLRSEVITAVRGAITGVMAGREPTAPMPELDLDFAVTKPADPLPQLRAEPEQALAAPDRPSAARRRGGLLAPILASVAVVGVAAGAAVVYWQHMPHTPQPSNPPTSTAPSPLPSIATTVAPAHPLGPPMPVAPPPAKPPDDVASSKPLTLAAPTAAKTAATAAAMPSAVTVVPAAPVTADPDPTAKAVSARDKPASTPAGLLAVARDQIEAGHLKSGRAMLLAPGAPETSDTALELARSYDPNFIRTLKAADDKPDVAEATRWYSRWYELAIKDGSVPKTMRLELLLHSLDNAPPEK